MYPSNFPHKRCPDTKVAENTTLINENVNEKENSTFIFAQTAFDEFKIIFYLFLPILLCNLCEFIPQYIAYGFVGHLPNATLYLASVGLSRTFTNCIGISITWGLSRGLGTLIPQALGLNDAVSTKKYLSIYFQQGVIITYIVLVPLAFLQYYAGDIMCLIGQSSQFCGLVNTYCRMLLPFIISSLWYNILIKLIRPLNLNKQATYILLTSAISSYPLNYLFVNYLEYGYIGTAIVMDICMIGNAFLIMILLIYKGYGYIFIPRTLSIVLSKNGIYTFLSLSIPTLFSSSISWWLSEMVILLTGYCYDPGIGISATMIAVTLNCMCVEMNASAATPMSIRIGKYIGFGSLKNAKRAMRCGLVLTTIVVSTVVIILLMFRNELPYVWISRDNKEVAELASNVIYFVCLRQVSYNLYCASSSVYVGIGYQKYTAVVSTTSNFLIAFPLALLLLFRFDLRYNENYIGLYVIWSCVSFGYAFSGIVLIFMSICNCINWNVALKQSQQRLKQTITYGSINNKP